MAADHLLYVGPAELLAIRAERRGGWRLVGRFAAGTDAASAGAAFEAFLRAHPRDRFELVVDVMDEEQHADELPRVGARDHRLLVRRRIEQRFREAEFALDTSLKATTARRDERGAPKDPKVPVLLSAIRTPAALSPWVPALRVAEREVGAMVSPALMAPRVAKRIRPHGSGLLAGVGPGGLRQTVVVDGRLRFSRLAAAIDGSDPDAVRLELLRTVQYLQMAQVVPPEPLREGRFELWLVADGIASPQRLPAVLALDNGTRVPVVRTSLAELRAPVLHDPDGLAPAGTGALALWLDPALRRPMGAGYANASLRRFERIARWRRGLWTAGAGAIAVASLGAAWVELSALRPDDPAALAQRTARMDTERARLERRIAAHPLPGTELEAVVRTAERLRARRVDAPALLAMLSAAMPDDPDLSLDEATWARTPPGTPDGGAPGGAEGVGGIAAAPTSSPAAGGLLPPLPGSGPGPAAMPVVGAPAPVAAGPFETPIDVVLRGTVAGHRAKTDANALVQRLADGLSGACACTVEVRRWPYDRGGGGGWTEEFADADAGARAVPFVIALRVPARATRTERIDVARR